MFGGRKLYGYASSVKRRTGKAYFRQIVEIFQLTCGPLKLGIQEYYELEIFDDAFYNAERKRDCVGWVASDRIDKKLNLAYWRATANDKVLNYALLKHFGLKIPETLATYSTKKRRIGSEVVLTNAVELGEFMMKAMPFPVFVKPVHGTYGRGTFSLVSYDAVTQNFEDATGKSVPMEVVLAECLKPKYLGMLIQKCLEPHGEVRRWVGATTSCVRVIIALIDGIPCVHFAFWKIARAHNITDNFHMGSTGNLLAALNKDTGLIERVVTGLWPSGVSLTHHPDTQHELVGKTLPDWHRAMEICKAAAICLPGLRLQHWDVAFCSDGPVLMELNTEADLGVPQFLARTPFVDAKIKQLIENN